MGINVLVLGTLVSEEQASFLLNHGIRPAPADIVQEYLIMGLSKDDRVKSIHSICSPRINSCLRNSIGKVSDSQFRISNCRVESMGFINLPICGFAHREKRIVSKAKSWAKAWREKQKNDNAIDNDQPVVIMYSMHSPFLKAAVEIKKMLPNSIILLIVADLPQFMGKQNKIKSLLKEIDRKRITSLLPVVDKYILYTKYMAEYFHLDKDKWIVCEGLINTDKIDLNTYIHKSNVCVYAGSLSPKYAIDTLVDAFEALPLNYSLHLYGNSAEAERLMASRQDYKKTEYKGLLPQKDIFEVMKQAKLLINPRPSSIDLAKYSCPSKTFEYMASGTPVLMTKLPGLPEEYYPYLYFFQEETKNGFVNALNDILSLEDAVLREKGKNAAEFLKREKSSDVQVSKILDFCCEQVPQGRSDSL